MRHAFLILIALAVTNIWAKADEKYYVVVAQAVSQSGEETWRILNDMAAPVDSEAGPMSLTACNYQAGFRSQAWIASKLPKWKLTRWWCIDVDEVDSFLAKIRSVRT